MSDWKSKIYRLFDINIKTVNENLPDEFIITLDENYVINQNHINKLQTISKNHCLKYHFNLSDNTLNITVR